VPLLWLHFGESRCVAEALVLLFVFGRDSNLYILRRNISYSIICLGVDILYSCRTKMQKVKKHDRHANHPTRNLGTLRMLPRMVPNFSKTQRFNHF
jgi:hypothetical protein